MQQAYSKQIEQFIDMFKTMMQHNAAPVPAPVPANSNQQRPRKKCPHCKKTHRNHGGCWELEKNLVKCQANWKSVKETWWGIEEEPTEQWQPGEVEINKLAKGFPYPVIPGFFPPPSKLIEPPDPSVVASPTRLIVVCSTPFFVASLKRARRQGRIKEQHSIQCRN